MKKLLVTKGKRNQVIYLGRILYLTLLKRQHKDVLSILTVKLKQEARYNTEDRAQRLTWGLTLSGAMFCLSLYFLYIIHPCPNPYLEQHTVNKKYLLSDLKEVILI